MTNAVKYLSETGLMDLCNWVYPEYISHNINKKPVIIPEKMRDGDIVYLWTTMLPLFCEEILLRIKTKFILITGISDYIFPYLQEYNKYTGWERLLYNPYLLACYCINKDIEHPKVHALPIGILRSLPFITSGQEEEEKFQYVAWTCTRYEDYKCKEYFYNCNKSPLEYMREKKDAPLLYINYTTVNTDQANITKNIGIRRKLDEYLEKCFERKPLVPWIDYMNDMRKYKFNLDPPGCCIDSYRIFESIITGTIPIIWSSPRNELFEDLPVLIINNFEEINIPFLENEYERISARTNYNFEKLLLSYWTDKIKRHIWDF